MRKFGLVVMTVLVGLLSHAQEGGFRLIGMESQILPVTGRKMTNVIFPVEIAAGVRVSRDVLVQKVKGVENVIELKALKRDFPATNLAVYGKDGRLYSFVLHYVEDTSVLDYRVVPDRGDESVIRLTGSPVAPERLRADARLLASRRGFMRRRVNGDGLRVALKGVYLRDSLLWLSLELKNGTTIDCGAVDLRIYGEDRKKVRRMATQEVEVDPEYADAVETMPGSSRRTVAVGLRPMLVGKGKRLVVEFSDRAGERQVMMKLSRRMLLRARR